MWPQTVGRAALALVVCGLAGCEGCGTGPELNNTVALLTPSVDTLEFGDVPAGTQKRRTLTLRSSGNGPVGVSGVRLEPPGAYSASPMTMLPTTLAPGSTLVVDVVFAPSAEGDAPGTLVVDNNSSNANPLRVTLVARGVAALDCDDRNVCTTDTLDTAAGTCVHTPVVGSCDDGTACTENDFCVATTCVGVARVCVDASSCTRDLCDAQQGCVFIPDAVACDDNNPCTAEVCHPTNGCSNVVLPNGTPCAPQRGCEALPLCREGACVDTAVPDGAPCNDQDLCTGPDRCSAGSCVGVRLIQDPVTVGVVPMVAGAASHGVALGSRFVVASALGAPWLFANGASVHETGGVVVQLVDPTGSPLQVLDTVVLPGVYAPRLDPVSDTAFMLAVRTTNTLMDQEPVRFHVGEVVGNSLRMRGSVEALTTRNTPYMAHLNGFVYVAGFGTQPFGLDNVLLDIRDPDAPVASTWSFPQWVGRVQVDPPRNRLLVSGAQSGVWQVYAADLTDPAAPVPAAQQPSGPGSAMALEGVEGDLAVGRDPLGQVPVLRVVDVRTFETVYTSTHDGWGVTIKDNQMWAVVHQFPGPPQLLKKRVDTQEPEVRLDLDIGGDAFGVGLGQHNAHEPLAVAGNNVLVPSRLGAAVVIRSMTLPGGLMIHGRVGGPGNGWAHRLEKVGAQVVAYSAQNVFAVDVEDGTGAASVAHWNDLPASAQLLRLGQGGLVLAIAGMEAGRLMERRLSFPASVVDATNLDTVEVVGSLAGETPYARGVVTKEGQLYVLSETEPFGVEVRDLAMLDGTVNQALPVVNFLPIGVPLSACWGMLDLKDSPYLLLVSSMLCVSGPGEVSSLVLVDVSTPRAPRIVATTPGDGPPGAWRTVMHGSFANNTLVTMTHTFLSDPYLAVRLDVLDHVPGNPGTLVPRSSLDVGGQGYNHVLGQDGHTVFVSTRTGVTILDVDRNPPAVRGTIPLPEPPLDAVFSGGRIHLSSLHAVTVVEPPCTPPLP